MGANKMSWRHPFNKKTITSRFGATANRPNAHRGLDYARRARTNIPAVTKGTVKVVQWSDVLGWVLVQSGWDNINKKTVFIGYCHLNEEPKLKPGAKIEMGAIVGRVGNTGNASRGAHLHLTIGPTAKSVFAGVVFDPETFIDQQLSYCDKCGRTDA
jgi:murein DD-endopeptidase MepM/ murein hydrolase activator NlpD